METVGKQPAPVEKGGQTGAKSIACANACKLYKPPEAESTMGIYWKSAGWLPQIALKLRNKSHVKSVRFWFPNRNGQPIEGILYGFDDAKPRPLVPSDFGLTRDVMRYRGGGVAISCIGCRPFSIRSHGELKALEADDYVDAMTFLRSKSEFKHLFSDESAFIAISGGGNVLYRSCSSQEFVESNGVKCGVSISTYAYLAKQFEYARKIILDPDIDEHTKRVLREYLKYADKTGLSPDSNPKEFELGSPATYAADVKIPILLIHGKEDEIVPATGSLQLYEIMKNAGKKAKLILVPGQGIHTPVSLGIWSSFAHPLETAGMLATLGYTYDYLETHLKLPQHE